MADIVGRPCGPAPPEAAYQTAAEAEKAVKAHAMANGYGLTLRKKYPNAANPITLTFACNKGRAIKTPSPAHAPKRRRTPSRMTHCPFTVTARLRKGTWCVYSTAKTHNHDASVTAVFRNQRKKALESHHAEILAMAHNGMRPRNIVKNLVEKHAHLEHITNRDISNLLYQHWKKSGEPPMEWLQEQSECPGCAITAG